MSIISKRLVKVLMVLLLCPGITLANEFDEKADSYINATHVTARNMADALFIHDLVETFMMAMSTEILNSADLESVDGELRDLLVEITSTDESDLSTQDNWQQNSFILEKVLQLRSDLSQRVEELKAANKYQYFGSVRRQEILLNSLRMLLDSCEKGRAYSPMNAGQTMPMLLKNSFSVEFNYSYNTDSGNSSSGGMASPENPNGDPAVIGVLGSAGSIAMYYGGPVGWAVAAGVAAVTYVYSSGEKRKNDINMTDAYLRTLDQQATSADVRNYYMQRCLSRKSTLTEIVIILNSRRFPEKIFSVLITTQQKNLATFERLSAEAADKEKTQLAKFLTKDLKSEDLIDLTMYALLKMTKEDFQKMSRLQDNLVKSDHYESMLTFLDDKIRILQKANYIFSLLEQDPHVVDRLVQDKNLFVETQNLIHEWQGLYVRAMAFSFKNVGLDTVREEILTWNQKVERIKAKLPIKVQQSLSKRSSLLSAFGIRGGL